MWRRVLVVILALPILPLAIGFDIVKLPVLVVFSPLWFLLDAIEVLKGDDWFIWEFIRGSLFAGTALWLELADFDVPEWME